MKHYVAFDDMTWPNPEAIDDVEWTLRYGTLNAVEVDRYLVASYVAAYKALFNLPQKTRNKRIEQIKREAKKVRDA